MHWAGTDILWLNIANGTFYKDHCPLAEWYHFIKQVPASKIKERLFFLLVPHKFSKGLCTSGVNKRPFPPTLVGEKFLKIARQGRIIVIYLSKVGE